MHSLMTMFAASSLLAAAESFDFARIKTELNHAVAAGYVDQSQLTSVRDRLDALTEQPTSREQVSMLLTNALRDATGDMHFSVQDSAQWYGQVPSVDDMLAESLSGGQPALSAEQAAAQQQENHYFRQASILAGNIGYVRIDRMPDIRLARETLAAAMQFVVHADALIVDLRYNPGGIGGFTPAMASYFMPEQGVELFARRTRSERQRYLSDANAGGPWSTKPLYVLISDTTGSAAENLAYTLQQRGRATLVGENSGRGGAHSATLVRLADDFVLALPFAKVINSDSGSNWHRTGVEPDVPTAPAAAMQVAHQAALRQLLVEADEVDRQRWTKALAEVQAAAEQKSAVACDEEALEPYTGVFGIREVRVRECALAIRRDGGTWLGLQPTAQDEPSFQMVLPTGAVSMRPLPEVRFEVSSGVAVELQFHHQDGSVERIGRSGD